MEKTVQQEGEEQWWNLCSIDFLLGFQWKNFSFFFQAIQTLLLDGILSLRLHLLTRSIDFNDPKLLDLDQFRTELNHYKVLGQSMKLSKHRVRKIFLFKFFVHFSFGFVVSFDCLIQFIAPFLVWIRCKFKLHSNRLWKKFIEIFRQKTVRRLTSNQILIVAIVSFRFQHWIRTPLQLCSSFAIYYQRPCFVIELFFNLWHFHFFFC